MSFDAADPPLVERRMSWPAVIPAFTSSGLKLLIVTLPPGLLTSDVNVAPPCVFSTMSPAAVFCSVVIVAGVGFEALRSIAMPFAATAESVGAATSTGFPDEPIAPPVAFSATRLPWMLPEGLPETVPVDVIVTEPPPALTAPAMVIAPLLLNLTSPPKLLTPVTVSAPVLVSATSLPAVLLALKTLTAFAPFKAAPLTETVASVPVVEIAPAPLSFSVPPAVSVTAPAPGLTAPVRFIAPVLLTDTLPPASLIPVTVKAPVFVRATSPATVFVALNAPTAFAPLRIVPPEDEVVSAPVVEINPAPLSLSAPLAVSATAPAPALTGPDRTIAPVLVRRSEE